MELMCENITLTLGTHIDMVLSITTHAGVPGACCGATCMHFDVLAHVSLKDFMVFLWRVDTAILAASCMVKDTLQSFPELSFALGTS